MATKKSNKSLWVMLALIVVIIVVSILPAVIEIWRNKRKKK